MLFFEKFPMTGSQGPATPCGRPAPWTTVRLCRNRRCGAWSPGIVQTSPTYVEMAPSRDERNGGGLASGGTLRGRGGRLCSAWLHHLGGGMGGGKRRK